MQKNLIVLEVYPQINNSLLLLSFDELKLPQNTDFSSIKARGDKGIVLFELIEKKGHSNKLDYYNCFDKTHIAIINNGSKKITIEFQNIKSKIKIKEFYNKNLQLIKKDINTIIISSKKSSIVLNDKGLIQEFSIGEERFGPLHLAASGGEIFFQEQCSDSKFEIVSDGNFIKIIKAESMLKVLGKESKNNGYLPFAINYTIYSPDGIDIYCNVEIELKFDKAVSFDGGKLNFLDCMLWYRVDNFNSAVNIESNILKENKEKESTILTLKHPYYSIINLKNNSAFGMHPYLALPCDGIHFERGKTFFGASWHSLSSKKSPYWIDFGLEGDKKSDLSQGYYPAQSLRSYWKIGLYFGNKKSSKDASKIFSYPAKIRNIVHFDSKNKIGNAYAARWKHNKKMAFHAMTDDAKVNDYIYRINGSIPKWVQMSISTRHKFGINYHRFCFINNKIFFLQKFPLISTLFSTFFCSSGIGKSLKQKFSNKNLSFLPHTNSHPKFYALNPKQIGDEIKTSEKVWTEKWKCPPPLSHILSWTAAYGLTTEKGTREKISFLSSKTLQWLREWPIPNAPVDFFLPTQLYWGIICGEIFNENNIKKIKEDFELRLSNGADYMIAAGHCPTYPIKCPVFVADFFKYVESKEDVWFTGADDLIKYYKCRENIFLGRPIKKGKYFEIEVENKLQDYFHAEITLMQCIGNNKKIECTIDGINYFNVDYDVVDKKFNVVMYDVPSFSKRIRLMVE